MVAVDKAAVKKDPNILDTYLIPATKISDIDVHSLKIETIKSGFNSLDELLFLKQNRGELIVIGGRPSIGKSAFMFQMARHVAEKHPVYIFSLEMPKYMIVTRLLSAELNKTSTAIQLGLVSHKLLESARAKLENLNYWVDERQGLKVDEICTTARYAKQQYGIKAIFIDYLQLLRSSKGHSRDAEIGTITRELKGLANELSIPVIIGSQLNRASEIRGIASQNYTPSLSDLRESGNIEQDADIVAFIHRQHKYTGERPGEADIIISKNRNGPTTNIVMQYVDAQTRFIDRFSI